jgi:hypothetical protein
VLQRKDIDAVAYTGQGENTDRVEIERDCWPTS